MYIKLERVQLMDFLNDFENEYVGMVGEVETIIYKLSLITKYIDLTE